MRPRAPKQTCRAGAQMNRFPMCDRLRESPRCRSGCGSSFQRLLVRREIAEVVNLAVKDDPVPGGRILHRLMAQRRKIDDGEAGVSETGLMYYLPCHFR